MSDIKDRYTFVSQENEDFASVMIKDGNDVRSLMKSGDLKSTAAFDFFDDRSKGSPQLLSK
jgi:hypothetical protein